ncbi:BTAD domain-containing putative transcriptional regulator [Deinococcus arenicola]|uniref:BTAD domain-containing putative transcriptional regulator n=1 Tax=Deinococcus arenicola TaxID=2994950 RepID=A0ABU4DWQ9_9DEIO|nr:BTAD domain-containing putative transcriptional regulator [Deinococcus sp. ZS9-10]MDV6376387.1 BTAD domain-containing putative transcriptional regulator [Deinococcus sp. ZS9-10]
MTHALLKAVLAGAYSQGLQLFEGLKRPSAQDLRWGGICCLNLGNMLKARHMLLTAVAQGDQAARIDLATCLRFEGEFTAAQTQLGGLDMDKLTAQDAALALRELAILQQHCGNVGRAAVLLSEAWHHSITADPRVQSAVAQSIALVAAQQGNDVKAESYFQFAEQNANPMRRVYVLLSRAASSTSLGKFGEAKQALKVAEKHAMDCPLAAGLLSYRWGMWFSAQGQFQQARECFGRAIRLARGQQQPETEFYAQLGLAALATATSDEGAERGSLARAMILATTPRAQAYLDWRQGAALVRRGDPHGFGHLYAALDYFQTNGCTREVVWALLHLTEAHAFLGSAPAARAALREAADAYLMLGSQHDLAFELNGLERTRQLLGTLTECEYERVLCAPHIPAPPVAEITLVTLGSPAILVDGQRVRLQMRKFIEVLAFLLQHGETTLGTLQTEVFAGVPPRRSKNYIHQVRHELKRLVPGLSVPYDAATHTYCVRSEGIHLTWDWQQSWDALLSSERDVMLSANFNAKDFLQDSESEWAETERERMSRWIVRVGLETMDAWYSTGDYAKCVKLAERLIEIEPLDEGLHDFLIRATVQVSGVGAARTLCWESRTLFAKEVGHVPHLLDVLAQQLHHKHLN